MHRREWLAQQINSHSYTRAAELGVRDGRTYLYLLQHCPHLETLIGVDIWAPSTAHGQGAESYAAWPQEENERVVRAGCTGSQVARLLKMRTSAAAVLVEDGSLDLVFIDAGHTTEAVREDIQLWRPKLRPGGLLCGDDYHWPSVRKAVDLKIGTVQTARDMRVADKLWFIFV
jgi:predicted O-methyltransferase YrrM